MNVLPSIANTGGYYAAVEAVSTYGCLFTSQVTAAGKMPPVTVYIIGAGVGGFAAIGMVNPMGVVVRATDLRPGAGGQVGPIGAEFIPIPAVTEESENGYARGMTSDQATATAELCSEQFAQTDIVITTANIPGCRPPLLPTAADAAAMKPGSIIADMTAAGGGNCEMTVPDRTIATGNDVTIIDYADSAGRLPAQISSLYGQNTFNPFKLITPEKDGPPVLSLEDEIIRGITVAKARLQNGTGPTGTGIPWPPPPVKVAVAPATPLQEQQTHQAALEESTPEKISFMGSGMDSKIALDLTTLLAVVVVLGASHSMSANFMILTLATVFGFYVISAITSYLHVSLVSKANVISGIVLVGAILQVGSFSLLVSGPTFTAIVVSSINILDGFAVTGRMLGMLVGEKA